jgi:type I restriction enzyme S subunit
MSDYQLPEGYKQTEIGVIPEDWDVKEFGNLGKFKNGINKSSEDFGYGSPFVNLMDVFGISFIEDNTHLGLVNSNEIEKNVYDLRKGDVLFIRSSVKPSGVGLTTVINCDLADTVYSGFLIRFRDSGCLEKDFKKYCFSEEKLRQRVIANSTVSANTNINQDNLKKIPIAYPKSIKEQHAIAATLSDVDALIAALDKLIAKQRHLKIATMQQLLTGKKRLLGFGESKGYKQTEVGLIPEDWEFVTLSEITEIATGQTPSTTNSKYYGDEFLFVSPADLGSEKYIKTTSKRLSSLGFSVSRKYPSFSVLFTCIGSTIGKCGILLSEGTSNQQINAVFPTESIDNEYLYYQLVKVAPKIKFNASEQAVPIVNKTEFGASLIPICKFEEQHAIATVLSDMDAAISALETRRAKTQAIKQGMMQELLTGKTRLIINE